MPDQELSTTCPDCGRYCNHASPADLTELLAFLDAAHKHLEDEFNASPTSPRVDLALTMVRSARGIARSLLP